jgi:hypothetical protein
MREDLKHFMTSLVGPLVNSETMTRSELARSCSFLFSDVDITNSNTHTTIGFKPQEIMELKFDTELYNLIEVGLQTALSQTQVP